MNRPKQSCTDERMEQILGNLLRAGVLIAATVVAAGGALYLARHGTELVDKRIFHGEPQDLRNPFGIVTAALALRGHGMIQLGLLLLIATPVARVTFSVFAFARQQDFTYVVVTLIVLVLLLYSLFAGQPSAP